MKTSSNWVFEIHSFSEIPPTSGFIALQCLFYYLIIQFSVKLNASLGFSVSKPNNSCFDIKWKKRNPGNCKINYNIAFISSSNYILDSVMADHSGSLLKCFSSQVKNIAKVNLTISSNATTEAKALITLPTPITVVATTNTKTQGKGESTVGRRISNFHIGYAVAVVLLLGLVLIFGIRVFKVRRMKKKGKDFAMIV